MNIKHIVSSQYQQIIDESGAQLREINMPPEGWLRVARKALKMSGAQLARRLGVTRSQVSKSEKNELAGGITVKTIQQMAEAMNCRLVYAIIPETTIKNIIETHALEKATKLVNLASKHMALENQTLTSENIKFEIARITKELIDTPPSDFWDD